MKSDQIRVKIQKLSSIPKAVTDEYPHFLISYTVWNIDREQILKFDSKDFRNGNIEFKKNNILSIDANVEQMPMAIVSLELFGKNKSGIKSLLIMNFPIGKYLDIDQVANCDVLLTPTVDGYEFDNPRVNVFFSIGFKAFDKCKKVTLDIDPEKLGKEMKEIKKKSSKEKVVKVNPNERMSFRKKYAINNIEEAAEDVPDEILLYLKENQEFLLNYLKGFDNKL